MQHQIPIGVVVVRHIGRVGNRTVIYHFAQGVGDAGQLLLTALEGQRRYDPAGLLVGLRKFVIGHLALQAFVVGQFLDGHWRPDGRDLGVGQLQVRVTGTAPGGGLAPF